MTTKKPVAPAVTPPAKPSAIEKLTHGLVEAFNIGHAPPPEVAPVVAPVVREEWIEVREECGRIQRFLSKK